ncbi:DMT family transporter [Yoonia sp. BS5-3]|uniref:DMT family transporter n=1 Tax=Yoonia phaeophyticola TaxID=3137369 RepID=A0ABZ2V8G2_9RHOB
MTKSSENSRGALLMMGAMCAYTVNDAFMKLATTNFPLFQAIMIRGFGAVLCLALMCRFMGQFRFDFRASDWALIALRTLCEVTGTYFFLTALLHMPIANISAILQALPLTVALGAALLFREPLGWRRLAAIAIGFVGVVLIIQPGGADFNSYSIYALITVLCVTVRDLAVRRMSHDVPPVFVALITAIGTTLLGCVGTAFTDMQPITGDAGRYIACATLFLSVGYILSVSAMRVGEIGFVAPFRYTSLLVALILGVLLFDEWPNLITILGASIVVATGLFTLYREKQIKQPIAPQSRRQR